jgi:Putative transposase DNA-binding domain
MAYGKGIQNLLRRAIPTGRTSLAPEVLPGGKLHDLLLLREKYLETASAFVDAVFAPEPLAGTLTGDELQVILTAKQKEIVDFNKAYAEKVRLSIPSIISQIESKYLTRLYGKLMNCSSQTGEAGPAKRQYLNLPIEIQDKVTLAELKAFEAKVSSLGFKKVLDLFRMVILETATCGLTEMEVLVVRTIHAECLAKYRKPEFGKDPRYTCQIHLDYRVIRNDLPLMPELDKGARLLVDRKNKKYHQFLEISNPLPRGESIRIPVVMSSKALKRFDKESSVSSLVVEIGATEVTVRTVISKPKAEPTLDGVTHLIGRDFGLVNTVSLSVVKLDQVISQDEVDRIAKFSQKEALTYLQNNRHPNDNVVKRIRYSGRKFLTGIETTCGMIDYLKSQIDTNYNSLAKLKINLCSYLGLQEDDFLPEDMLFKDRFVQVLYHKFFRVLQHIQRLKKLRFSLYAKIAAKKKAWFGFLSNQEIILAKHFNAAIVREDLTILAKEKETPDYKGRTFNKMINNGSKGQYLRRASDKMNWDGIPEIIIPSYYTSTVCTVHSLMNKAFRSGEIFRCPACEASAHADEHAADTIANYLLLRPA